LPKHAYALTGNGFFTSHNKRLLSITKRASR
jgi:hypothetical protein